jgi:hypothetical protein
MKSILETSKNAYKLFVWWKFTNQRNYAKFWLKLVTVRILFTLTVTSVRLPTQGTTKLPSSNRRSVGVCQMHCCSVCEWNVITVYCSEYNNKCMDWIFKWTSELCLIDFAIINEHYSAPHPENSKGCSYGVIFQGGNATVGTKIQTVLQSFVQRLEHMEIIFLRK